MLLRVAFILVQSVLQFQGQRVVVGPYDFQNLTRQPKTAESASTDASAQEQQG